MAYLRDARQETGEYVRPGVVRVREFNEMRNNSNNNNNSFNNAVQGNTITRQRHGDLNDVFDDYVYIILVFFIDRTQLCSVLYVQGLYMV